MLFFTLHDFFFLIFNLYTLLLCYLRLSNSYFVSFSEFVRARQSRSAPNNRLGDKRRDISYDTQRDAQRDADCTGLM